MVSITTILFTTVGCLRDCPAATAEITEYFRNEANRLPSKTIINYADKKEYNRPLIGDRDEIASELVKTFSLKDLVGVLCEGDYVIIPVYFEGGDIKLGYSINENTAGFAYTTKETIIENFGEAYSQLWEACAQKYIKKEIEESSMFLC